MRISINLATRPYVELGPIYKRLRLLILALALLAAPLWLLLHLELAKAAMAHQDLAVARQRLAALQRQEQAYQSEMRLPQNAAVLRQSQFLNQLFERKAFSWTAVMMDLEKVLPGGVQVENIDPVISQDGSVTIRLRVSGEHDRAVDLVRNLEHSHRFLFPRVADEAAVTNSQGGRNLEPVSTNEVNLDVLADYNPLPATAQAGDKQAAKEKSAAPPPAKHTPHRPKTLRTPHSAAAQPPRPGPAASKAGPR